MIRVPPHLWPPKKAAPKRPLRPPPEEVLLPFASWRYRLKFRWMEMKMDFQSVPFQFHLRAGLLFLACFAAAWFFVHWLLAVAVAFGYVKFLGVDW